MQISNLLINKKKREVPDNPEHMFEEEEHNNNPSIQLIKKSSLTVNISMKSMEQTLNHFLTLC